MKLWRFCLFIIVCLHAGMVCHADWREPDRHEAKETLARLNVASDILVVGQIISSSTVVGQQHFIIMKIDRIIASTWKETENDQHTERLSIGTCIYIMCEKKTISSPIEPIAGFQYLCWLKARQLTDEQKQALKCQSSICYTAPIAEKKYIVQLASIPDSSSYMHYLKLLDYYKKTKNETMVAAMARSLHADDAAKLRYLFGIENLTVEQVLNCTSTIAKLMSAEKNNEEELVKFAKLKDPLLACTSAFLLSNYKDKIRRFKYVEVTPKTQTDVPVISEKESKDKTNTTLPKKSPL